MPTAAIDFLAGQGGGTFVDLNASGLGFFGNAHGTSVQVGEYQDTTFITSSNGSIEGPQGTNCKYDAITSGVFVDSDSVAVAPSAMVINSGTMNMRFTFSSPDTNVQTQNGELRIFDRIDPTTGAVGVTTQLLQIVNGGSGVSTSGTAEALASHSGWIAASGDTVISTLLSSPGSGGLSPSGTDTEDSRHDWYICLSATPLSIGSKTAFGLYCQLEYF